MLTEWIGVFWTSLILVTALAVVVLAICGALVAGWTVRDYLRTRGTAPVDWYALTTPEDKLRRNQISPLRSTPRQKRGGASVWPEQEPQVEELYTQDELPF